MNIIEDTPLVYLTGQVWVELRGRAAQGVGAAFIAPSALTLLIMLFGSEPRELTKALALYGAAAATLRTAHPGSQPTPPPAAEPASSR